MSQFRWLKTSDSYEENNWEENINNKQTNKQNDENEWWE